MKVLKEGGWLTIIDFLRDNLMNLIDEGDIIWIDPDDRDNIEKGSSFLIKFGIGENSVIDVFKQVFDNVIELIECLMLVFFQVYVDSPEELERIVNDLIVIRLEIVDTEENDIFQEILKLFEVWFMSQVLPIQPKDASWDTLR